MKIIDCIQGSPEWQRLRAGIPTASRFDDILTPGGKPSASAERYLNTLAAEIMLGRPLDSPTTALMDRGTDLEGRARTYYAMHNLVDVRTVGFITNDAGTAGASPDGLVDSYGLAEFKCPDAHTHVGYLMSEDGVGGKYKPQVQGQLWICERDWCDTVSYYPGMPISIRRHVRDDEYIEKLAKEVDKFLERLAVLRERIVAEGWMPDPPKPPDTPQWLREETEIFNYEGGLVP